MSVSIGRSISRYFVN